MTRIKCFNWFSHKPIACPCPNENPTVQKIMLFSDILPIGTSMGYNNTQTSGLWSRIWQERPVSALIIDPEDIKSKQQQPGLLYVATSCVKTIGDMTQDVPHPKTSALYWTGSGMSVNRVLKGTTKKQQNTQGQERVNCLKIDKRRKWVRCLT